MNRFYISRDEITIDPGKPRWKCIESREDNKRLRYGRFFLAPLMEGQADIIGIAMRRALIGEVHGTCITCVKLDDVPHEYTTIPGVRESVYEIVMNLKNIVLSSHIQGTSKGSISFMGPGDVTAKDIKGTSDIRIVDKTQHIAHLEGEFRFSAELEIQRHRGFFRNVPFSLQEGHYPIRAKFTPILNVNHGIHTYKNGSEKIEVLFLEIWTNGALTPKEALWEAGDKLINLFLPGFDDQEDNGFGPKYQYTIPLSPFTFQDKWDRLRKRKTKIALKSLFIDQFDFSPKIYSCLKKAGLFTVMDLFRQSQRDLMKIEYLGFEDLKEMYFILEKFFETDLPENL